MSRNGVFRGIYRHVFVPPCECVEFKQQFRSYKDQCVSRGTYTTALSDEEARETVSNVRQEIFDNVQYLQEQYKLNGNTILKRWKKKTSDERKVVMLEVDPQM